MAPIGFAISRPASIVGPGSKKRKSSMRATVFRFASRSGHSESIIARTTALRAMCGHSTIDRVSAISLPVGDWMDFCRNVIGQRIDSICVISWPVGGSGILSEAWTSVPRRQFSQLQQPFGFSVRAAVLHMQEDIIGTSARAIADASFFWTIASSSISPRCCRHSTKP
jgi:hypothetical protein